MSESSKKSWSKPSLTPHRMGALNKFGSMHGYHYQDKFEGVSIAELLAKYGSPLFVISEQRLRDNVRKLLRAFETRYGNVTYAWSYKTNYLGAVCNTLHQEGAWAEVVSAFEYEKARQLGVPAEKILFNGPHKERPILERVVAEGGRIHLDHLDELYLLESIARDANKQVNVTMRLNFDTGYTEPWSRFGFNIESGKAMDAARLLGQSSHLNLCGLHSHMGTFILDPRAYAAQVRIMCAFMDQAELATGCRIDSIDIGGGFASMNALQGSYLPPEQLVPSFDQYAEAICTALNDSTRERDLKGRARPRLIMESGRSVVDDAEVLISSVVGNKHMLDGRRSLVLDAGVNLLFTAFWYNHQVTPTRLLEGVAEDTVLYGPLCMNIDVMRTSVMLPPLNVGDSLIFSPVGAYNNTQWMQFIEYRPNVVMVHADQQLSVVRKAENLDVMIAQESIPAHLTSVKSKG
ncbi:MAG: diaminopimelate decarboxylase [Zetaproteobacteria bacterium CG_4_9_14_3_um_filter_49_83]|nr:MAG: diaminopimelate decarboxylase [Zetaproteobacteria bacterium CG1_02_49_23]PIQ33324.1 MAG: diaminopimelate decarboxylase [Zetaproteobacteria bacterium CG17_big_fil_post_rev_8_21_14_2_50_50_13]PIV29021.1 MAG: diaminopimelate decarboxylase [Zetaproteobacteria bacterium CG02_land_8_20_14_3_00_50_9]PIY57060.1 MAG: diaminopimelate decarboxylase [Zetaproteobacteria bacterium CG_4_10_14_0_8_um_filter_49_80]PJA34400.1 MAG: diaminopimelate decarboxylase [Zetaproteobacteria bacterium CG_4_9_14_3_um